MHCRIFALTLVFALLVAGVGFAQSSTLDAVAGIQQQLQNISVEELLDKLARVQSISYHGRKHLRLRAQNRLVMEQAQAVRQRYNEDVGGFKSRVDRVVIFLRDEGRQLLEEQDDAKLETRFAELRAQHRIGDDDIESFIEWADARNAYQICQREMDAIAANLEASIPRIPPSRRASRTASGSLSDQATLLSAERKESQGGVTPVVAAVEPETSPKQERARDVLERLLKILPAKAAE